ncbi:hypothetical protein [Kurthia sibirica]|uniref:Uncharacterized protein n=1 Tax=Kurthia sibirica TaxID=202750 RepID=A0A2U3AN11_9BACL|nr:hypothetical protein [Kurthia sibirica]PWI25928.1 hypothetical protein DEX24_05190 [Kurthia sibirica]GEK34284.1 hypothetical protein KSI01_18170 [Kurthia sibirica]
MVSIEKLVEIAEEAKEKGDYDQALTVYAQAISIESSNSNLYRGYGQIAYLVGQHHFAVAAYLSALHIEIAKIEHFGFTDDTQKMYEELPQNLRDQLPKVGGFIMYYDTNTLRHLAHALIDFDEDAIQADAKLLAFKEIYAAELAGNEALHTELLAMFNRSSMDAVEEDASFYIQIGKELALHWIKWHELHSLDVGKLYFP